MNKKLYEHALQMIANNPELLEEIPSEANLQLPTLNTGTFWNSLVIVDGWKLQQHSITGHVRILDPSDIRKAWGDSKNIKKSLKNLANNCREKRGDNWLNSTQKLLDLKKLLDAGVISQNEFEKMKQDLLDDIMKHSSNNSEI